MSSIADQIATKAADQIATLEGEREKCAQRAARAIVEGPGGMRTAHRNMEMIAKVDGMLEVWREAAAAANHRSANGEDNMAMVFLTKEMIARPARALNLVGAQTGSRELDMEYAAGIMQAAAVVLDMLAM